MESEEFDLEEATPFVPASLYKKSPIHNYFVYNKETNKSVCKNKNCEAEIQGKNSTNQVNHLKIPVHINDEYRKYVKELSNYKEASTSKKRKLSKTVTPKLPQPTLQHVRINCYIHSMGF
jgi:hypothetical protein